MSTNPRYANGNARRKARRIMASRGDVCHICGLPIDYSLPALHPYSFEIDELVPISYGGSPYDLDNLAASHRICNERRGNKLINNVNKTSTQQLKRSVRWAL